MVSYYSDLEIGSSVEVGGTMEEPNCLPFLPPTLTPAVVELTNYPSSSSAEILPPSPAAHNQLVLIHHKPNTTADAIPNCGGGKGRAIMEAPLNTNKKEEWQDLKQKQSPTPLNSDSLPANVRIVESDHDYTTTPATARVEARTWTRFDVMSGSSTHQKRSQRPPPPPSRCIQPPAFIRAIQPRLYPPPPRLQIANPRQVYKSVVALQKSGSLPIPRMETLSTSRGPALLEVVAGGPSHVQSLPLTAAAAAAAATTRPIQTSMGERGCEQVQQMPPISKQSNQPAGGQSPPITTNQQHPLLLARQQLLIIYHTITCQQRGLNEPCSLPFCSPMRQLLTHMRACRWRTAGQQPVQSCSIKFCTTTSQLISHWNGCKNTGCIVCGPVRDVIIKRRVVGKGWEQQGVNTNPPSTTTSMMEVALLPNHHQDQTSTTTLSSRDWRADFTTQSRIQVMREIISTLFKSASHQNLPVQPLAEVVKRTESKAYTISTSRGEYLARLATKTRNTVRGLNTRAMQGVNLTTSISVGGVAASKLPSNPPPPTTSSGANKHPITTILKQSLTLLMNNPDSIAFRHPVDHLALNLPDYPLIVKKPMDLSTIQCKLENGDYNQDPWNYIQDVYLMFDNAWKYNKKSSRIYKNCTNLAHLFDTSIDPVMKSLGYCCGKRYTFKLQDAYNKECKDGPPPEPEPEPLVKCGDCGKRFHTICTMYMEEIWGRGFTCSDCLVKNSIPKHINNYTASSLPTTVLSKCIQSRIEKISKNRVTIRVASSTLKSAIVSQSVMNRFAQFHSHFPYHSKVILAFQLIENVDVCFFAMYVQEYDYSCAEPNTKRVYIAYLDSVNYYEPREERTIVYHEIVLGYLEHVKNLGFTTAHIWACPPQEGCDYIFRCHPLAQKTPKSDRLQNWYKKMLEKGRREGILQSYKSSFQEIILQASNNPLNMPYFEGDLWPKILEDSIQELQVAEKRDLEPKPKKRVKKSKTKLENTDLPTIITKNLRKLRDEEVFFIIKLQNNNQIEVPDPDPLLIIDFIDSRDQFLQTSLEKRWEFSTLRRAKFTSMGLLYLLHTEEQLYTCNHCGVEVQVQDKWHCSTCEDYDLCKGCFASIGHEHEIVKGEEGTTITSGGGQPTKDVKQGTSEADEIGGEDKIITSGQMEVDVLNVEGEEQSGVIELEQTAPPNSSDDVKPPQSTPNENNGEEANLIHSTLCKNTDCRIASCFEIKQLMWHTTDCTLTKSGRSCPHCSKLMRLLQSHKVVCVHTSSSSICPLWFCPNHRGEQQLTTPQQRGQSPVLLQIGPPQPPSSSIAVSKPCIKTPAFHGFDDSTHSALVKVGCSREQLIGSLVQSLTPRLHSLFKSPLEPRSSSCNPPTKQIPPFQLVSTLRTPTINTEEEKSLRILKILTANPHLIGEIIRSGSGQS